MRKARILLVLGTWVTALPYLGIPHSWKDFLLTITGLGLIYFSYVLYKNHKMKESQKKVFDNFRENTDFDRNQNTAEEIEASPEYRSE